MDRNGLDWLSLHVDVPDLDGKIVAGENVTTVMGKANVGDGGDDFGEEGAGGGVFFLLEFYGMSV